MATHPSSPVTEKPPDAIVSPHDEPGALDRAAAIGRIDASPGHPPLTEGVQSSGVVLISITWRSGSMMKICGNPALGDRFDLSRIGSSSAASSR